ncbi:MAG: hydantoinase/oxoprolinase family protein [Chloroflexi bacterium]|nr:hydantoinase/oxoprolinase family protein [Chloroflexota bacterium]
MAGPAGAYRVGVDIGGTFTDLVVLAEDGRVLVGKAPSTVDDYSRGIVDALGALLAAHDLDGSVIAEVVHGTTVASNAILERAGASVGLITTRGFRDVLEIRRLRVPRLYDLTWEKPPPLVERARRIEVDERVSANGAIRQPLDQVSLAAALARLRAEEVKAIAVCLLNSYANPIHEQVIAAWLRDVAPDLDLSISCEVLPEIKEYDRTSTTVVNAYIRPVVRRYLQTLGERLGAAGIAAPLLVMQSNGGIMSAAAAAARPVTIIESGPAAGVVGAQALAERLGLPDLITVDIGGTTAKAAMVEGGQVYRAGEYEVGGGIIAGARLLRGAGYLVRLPAIDLAEVGAGGGSLLWLDPAGSLQVGPRSAGALPGPVCYGLGGTEPTITDANLVLGYINPERLAGGAVRLHADLAHRVIDERVARPLGLPLDEAAHGAHVLAAAAMIRAIRAVSSERGRDPRAATLCAFGGNGPLFAATMARALEMRQVLIPPLPGLFSALGLLASPLEHHLSRSALVPLATADPAALTAAYRRLEDEAAIQLAAEGVPAERMELHRAADLRYQGQSFELTVPAPAGPLISASLTAIGEAFGAEHARTYGHRAGADEPVELVNLRLVARARDDRRRLPAALRHDPATLPATARLVFFGRAHGWLTTPVLTRAQVPTTAIPGPLIVEEFDATAVVPPDATIRREAWDVLRLELPEP